MARGSQCLMRREKSAEASRPVESLGFGVYGLGGPPTPVTMTIIDNKDSIRVLLYSYYTTITGWRGPPNLWVRKAKHGISRRS